MHKFTIEYYKKEDGSCPVEEFLDSLEGKLQAKIFRLILLLEQNGNDLREPYSKYLAEGIFELRIQQGTNIARILYFFVVGQKIVLTNGFVKKTQKTPTKEIEVAKKCRMNYLKRGGN